MSKRNKYFTFAFFQQILYSVLAVGLALPQQQSYGTPSNNFDVRSGGAGNSIGGGGFQGSSSSGGGFSSGGFESGASSQGSFDVGSSSSQGSFIDGSSSVGGFESGSSLGGFESGASLGGFERGSSSSQGSFDAGFSSQGNFGGSSQGTFSGGFSSQRNLGGCGGNQVRHVDGSCVEPEVERNFYLYNAPAQQVARSGPVNVPKPKVIHNVVFVRVPDTPEGQEPIVVPPPQHKTLVYVLNKNGQISGQRVIEVPAGPAQKPEVFFVNYDEGSNPQLGDLGVDLQTALSRTETKQGQVVGSGSSGISSGSGLSGISSGFSSGSGLSGSSSGFSSGSGLSSGSSGISGGFSSGGSSGFVGSSGGSVSGGGDFSGASQRFENTIVGGGDSGSSSGSFSSSGGSQPSQSYGSPN